MYLAYILVNMVFLVCLMLMCINLIFLSGLHVFFLYIDLGQIIIISYVSIYMFLYTFIGVFHDIILFLLNFTAYGIVIQ